MYCYYSVRQGRLLYGGNTPIIRHVLPCQIHHLLNCSCLFSIKCIQLHVTASNRIANDIIPPHLSTPRQLSTVHIVYIYLNIPGVSIYSQLQHSMTEKYPIGTRSESERLVRDWGFRHVFTWSDGRYVDQRPIYRRRMESL